MSKLDKTGERADRGDEQTTDAPRYAGGEYPGDSEQRLHDRDRDQKCECSRTRRDDECGTHHYDDDKAAQQVELELGVRSVSGLTAGAVSPCPLRRLLTHARHRPR